MNIFRENFLHLFGEHIELKYVVIEGEKSVLGFSNAFEFCFNLNFSSLIFYC